MAPYENQFYQCVCPQYGIQRYIIQSAVSVHFECFFHGWFYFRFSIITLSINIMLFVEVDEEAPKPVGWTRFPTDDLGSGKETHLMLEYIFQIVYISLKWYIFRENMHAEIW